MKTQDLTRNQSLVFSALNDAKTPLTAYAILDELRGEGFRAPLQVYRALEKLVERGLVHRLESVNSFIACAHEGASCCKHGLTGFAICTACGNTMEFHHHGVEHQLEALLGEKGFKPEKTVVEIRGLCANCA
ncbi:Fur family transcriptional regulator [Rhizobium sp. L1K21]|uniref:Fur family transcriptional regulator n=1 Tax=Rhizobium sp. L1K21 TaxID=2954933 RepID=UPI002091EF48|nr:Fur family transcriptional regulator [Rhizobium sp. L1K21]MCO6186176.1 transcriptional repressor [Rhizobium sp. L1K21]